MPLHMSILIENARIENVAPERRGHAARVWRLSLATCIEVQLRASYSCTLVFIAVEEGEDGASGDPGYAAKFGSLGHPRPRRRCRRRYRIVGEDRTIRLRRIARACLQIRREQKMNMSIFRRSRIERIS